MHLRTQEPRVGRSCKRVQHRTFDYGMFTELFLLEDVAAYNIKHLLCLDV